MPRTLERTGSAIIVVAYAEPVPAATDTRVAEARAALERLLAEGMSPLDHRIDGMAQCQDFAGRLAYYHMRLLAALKGLAPHDYEQDSTWHADAGDDRCTEGPVIVTPAYHVTMGGEVRKTDQRVTWRRKEQPEADDPPRLRGYWHDDPHLGTLPVGTDVLYPRFRPDAKDEDWLEAA